MTRFRVVSDRSRVWIEARSSLHPIHGEGTGIEGEAELGVTNGRIDLNVPPKGRIEIPVERLGFDISTLPEDALDEINRIQTGQRLNEVVKTGIPGFIPQGR